MINFNWDSDWVNINNHLVHSHASAITVYICSLQNELLSLLYLHTCFRSNLFINFIQFFLIGTSRCRNRKKPLPFFISCVFTFYKNWWLSPSWIKHFGNLLRELATYWKNFVLSYGSLTRIISFIQNRNIQKFKSVNIFRCEDHRGYIHGRLFTTRITTSNIEQMRIGLVQAAFPQTGALVYPIQDRRIGKRSIGHSVQQQPTDASPTSISRFGQQEQIVVSKHAKCTRRQLPVNYYLRNVEPRPYIRGIYTSTMAEAAEAIRPVLFSID